MANIKINNLAEELGLIKTALKRATDTRKIVGGLSSNFEIETRGGMIRQF